MDMDRYIGRILDNRYEILEVIGIGGMAVVYKARCHRLNRLVAIKILKDEYSQDEEFRRRFHAESQAVAMLSHPNIVSVYDVSTSDDADYIVMELIDGITLKQYMEKKGVLNWKETLHFAMQIGKALEHAHSRGIVHRDIKPHNVMVLKNGSVKVADFGIARVMSKSNTLTKEALGSVHYISPEQAKGGRVDHRSDLYSLGVVMYEMMTGRPPYDGESPVAIAIQHINGVPTMPTTLNPNIPGGLEQIILHAMQQNPAERYATATAMLTDMDEFRKNPAILFDYQNPASDIDAAIRFTPPAQEDETAPLPKPVREVPAQPAPRPEPKPVRKTTARRREEVIEEDEDGSSKVATIAVIFCAVAAVIAIGVFIFVLARGGLTQGEVVRVPNLLDMTQEELGQVTDVAVLIGDKKYSDTFASGHVMYQNPQAGTQIAKGGKVTVEISLGPRPMEKKMVDLVELGEAAAKKFLTNTLEIDPKLIEVKMENHETIPEGSVIRTSPVDGEKLAENQTVTLWISLGPEIKTGKVPNVLGHTSEKAQELLDANGFKNVLLEEVDSNREKGTVIHQSIDAPAVVDLTTIIVLQISKGPEPGATEPNQPTLPTVDPDLVSKIITIELPPETVEDYTLSVWKDGEMLEERLIPAGALSTEFELTGKGIMTFELRINNANPWPIEVNFDGEE